MTVEQDGLMKSQSDSTVETVEDRIRRLLNFKDGKNKETVSQLEELISLQRQQIEEDIRPLYPRGLKASFLPHWRGQVWNAWKQKKGLHRDDLYESGRSLHTRKGSNYRTLSRRKYKPIR